MENEVVDPIEVEEIVEGNEIETEPKEVERPWKKKEEEDKPIPYSRFKDVNDEKRLYKERVEQYEKELAELREKVTPSKKEIEDADELDPNDFETVKDYLKARDKVQADKIQRDFMERMENTRRQKEVEEYQTKVINDFQSKVSEAVKYNPEIVDAIGYIEQFADRINPHVRRALLTDDNSPDLCFEIATNPELLRIVVQGDPIDAVRAMSRWSAKFTREEGIAEAPTKNKAPENIKAMIPKTLKGTVTKGTKRIEDMSASEYRKYRGM